MMSMSFDEAVVLDTGVQLPCVVIMFTTVWEPYSLLAMA